VSDTQLVIVPQSSAAVTAIADVKPGIIAAPTERHQIIIKSAVSAITPTEIAPAKLIVIEKAKSHVIAAGIPGRKGDDGASGETSPAFTYTAGRVSRIDYASGAYKLFIYAAGVLVQLDYVVGAVTTRKTFTYSQDGSLAAIMQEVV
jgi:hypothetical protein